MIRIALIVLVVFLLLGFLYLLDEFENERPLITIGFITITVVISIIAIATFRLSYHHVCPLCGRDLGNRGDVVSRQILNIVAAYSCLIAHKFSFLFYSFHLVLNEL